MFAVAKMRFIFSSLIMFTRLIEKVKEFSEINNN
jgi:hypothetical protein